jgi:hypothetical protein
MECTHWGVVELLVAAGMVAAFHVRKVPPAIPSIRQQLGADALPDPLRLVLAGVCSAVIGVIPVSLFTAIPVHAPRPARIGAATGLLMQGSSVGALPGQPITGAPVCSRGWPAAARLTSITLGIAAVAGIFLHWREGRKLAP